MVVHPNDVGVVENIARVRQGAFHRHRRAGQRVQRAYDASIFSTTPACFASCKVDIHAKRKIGVSSVASLLLLRCCLLSDLKSRACSYFEVLPCTAVERLLHQIEAGVQLHRPHRYLSRGCTTPPPLDVPPSLKLYCDSNPMHPVCRFLPRYQPIGTWYASCELRAVAVIVGNRTAIRAFSFSQSRRVSKEISRHLFTGSNSDSHNLRATHRPAYRAPA